MISSSENCPEEHSSLITEIKKISNKSKTPVLGITGTGGAGKSSLVDELVKEVPYGFSKKRYL